MAAPLAEHISARPRLTAVNVIHRVQVILEQFGGARRTYGLNELVRATALPKATVHRLANDLCTIGLLAQSAADRSYRLGPLAARLANPPVDTPDLRHTAFPILRELAQHTGETVLLMALDRARMEAVCIEQITSRHGLRIVSEVGSTLPLHAGGAGKAILAFLDPAERARVLAAPLKRVARRTKTDAAALEADLARSRKLGYARSTGESLDGAAGFGVPVFDRDDTILASITIVGPVKRMHDAIDRWLDPALAAARRLSEALAR